MKSIVRGVMIALILLAPPARAQQTRAERTKYAETSLYTDVISFLDSLQQRGAKIHIGFIGRTMQGRDVPYVIASRPLVTTPLEAKRLNRPIVYVQGNIHSGEVEGKEALLALLRDLTMNPKPNVLDSIVLIAVPDYNADGNEALAPQARNRGAQQGPEMVGTRPNAQGINLNRDYVRAETPETKGSLAMFNAWDPDVFVDLHTTDGSYHGYALTYAPSLHPAAAIPGATFGGAFARDSMLPVLRARMKARDHFAIFDYGNFSGDEGPRAGPGEARSWSTYSHTPRYGTNYYALRGRISVLSEAFSHDPFEKRVKSTYAFVHELLGFTAERAKSVLALNRSSDAGLESGKSVEVPIRAALTAHGTKQIVVEEMLDTIPEAREALRAQAAAAAAARANGGGRGGRGGGGAAGGGRGGPPACAWPLTQAGMRCGMVRTGKFVNQNMLVRDRFDGTLSAKLPVAYLIRKMPGQDSLLAQLRLHGVVVERLMAPLDARGELFTVDSVTKLPPGDGHSDIRVTGAWADNMHVAGDQGDYIVRGAQPLGVLAVILLEPLCDDGLTAWNYFDAALDPLMKSPNRTFPVARITAPVTVTTRIIP
ncbi:MAG TPA: M14 family metallopeptidase [Gemmatimonadaceae bacterium]|nr:M14 family metallopeptidase [Gemmatimonadaceae bacterium]